LARPASPSASYDRPLVALAVAGDKLAFTDLVRRHGSAVRVLLRWMGAQPAVADDVAQDAFLAAWRQIGRLRDDQAFEPWVKQIAARLYLKQWRKAGRYQALDTAGDEPSYRPDPSTALDLDVALSRLSDAERLCVTLNIGAGFAHEELAQTLSLPLGTVKSHVRRGLGRLKTLMGAQEAQS
jgi:RNA polymerase sigma factor (sigma-70 family)